jgi:hypothetical protein
MRKSERDALLERAKKLRRGKQQRAGFTDFMAMSESPLVKQAKERLDGRKGAKATSGTVFTFKDTGSGKGADPKGLAKPRAKMQANRAKSQGGRSAAEVAASKKGKDPRGNQIKATPGTAKKKEASKKFNVGVSKGGVSFREAFKHYRGLGQSTFTWNGKKYTTDVKKAKPKAKISTPTPADFTAKSAPTKTAPKKKTTTKSNDPRKNFSSKATPGSNLPAGAIRKFNSKTGYNSKKERLRKVGDTTYVFKKG